MEIDYTIDESSVVSLGLSESPDGPDISYWQGEEFNPDLYQPDFIAIRAGHGEYTDIIFDSNVQKASRLNIPIIAYWYIMPNVPVSLQIARFLKICENEKINGFCLDYEEWKYPGGNNYTVAEITQHMQLSFSQLSAGIKKDDKMLLYTGRAYLKYLINPASVRFKEYLISHVGLWIAIPANEIMGAIAPFKTALFRQYGKYTTPGFSSPVDHNSFLGTLAELREWAGMVIMLEERVAALEIRVTRLENKGV